MELPVTTQHQDSNETIVLGFWVYILTDCVLFASLFAAFAVLRNNTFGGPSGQMLFNLPLVLTETLLLLTSSFTCGLAVLAAGRQKVRAVISWLAITWLLGAAFLAIELNEFAHFVQSGNSWQRSGFLSSFFTLVGTHGIHITIGLLWMAVFIVQLAKRGLNASTIRKLTTLSLFWHFLDIVWIFIFSIVYLMGATR